MDEFYKRMKQLLNESYDNFIASLKQPPYKSFYLNPARNPSFLDKHQDTITPHPIVQDSYYYSEEYHPGRSPLFVSGAYYIQEPSAMLVAHYLDVEPDDYVIDLCAAPGGKTCAVASQLNNQGFMLANDISNARAKILSENCERFGLKNTIVTSANPKSFIGLLDSFFDKVILDAPCSGEGMLRTTEQAEATWSEDKVKECALIQRQLIDIAMTLLKPGGTLMYSTCTYAPEENEETIRYALSHHQCHLVPLEKSHGLMPGIKMEEAVRCYPHLYQGEGHFMAKLIKDEQGQTKRIKYQTPSITKKTRAVVEDFYHQHLNINVPKHLVDHNGHIYAICPQFPELPKIRILRNGLYLGEVRKNRFIPSHSLALTLSKDDVKLSYDFDEDDEDIKRYLHGETLPSRGGKGYGVIFVDDQPLSFFKESHEIKNLLPKGLRR